MDETGDGWRKNLPKDLLLAIEHLRTRFEEAHWSCGQTTQRFCFAMLHHREVYDPTREYGPFLISMKLSAGSAARRMFNELIQEGTPPAVFKAFFDFYLDGLGTTAVPIFRDIIQISRSNSDRLDGEPLEWAEAQAKSLIGSQRGAIRNWVRNVCDIHAYDENETDEEFIFWTKWQAPAFIVMYPSRYRPYDPEKAWDRCDAETSSKWLDHFADDYVARLEGGLAKLIREAALDFAKQPRSAQPRPGQRDDGESKGHSSHAAFSLNGRRGYSNTLKRDLGKLNTEKKYRSWQKAFKRLATDHPDRTDGWYSQKISEMAVANGCSAATIRKHMRK